MQILVRYHDTEHIPGESAPASRQDTYSKQSKFVGDGFLDPDTTVPLSSRSTEHEVERLIDDRCR